MPLVSEEDYVAAIGADEAPADPHDRMLARLKHELAERKRLEVERKELLQRKSKISKANDEKKAKLDDLEAQLDKFLEVRYVVLMVMLRGHAWSRSLLFTATG